MAYEMVMPYHLHMPSYFLETFTEYPYMNQYGIHIVRVPIGAESAGYNYFRFSLNLYMITVLRKSQLL